VGIIFQIRLKKKGVAPENHTAIRKRESFSENIAAINGLMSRIIGLSRVMEKKLDSVYK
jgi:hypothetical protein